MAYECSPYRGSEWAVGWGRLLQAAREFETHVVTSEDNYKALERARGEGLVPSNVRFYTPEPDAKLRAMERKPKMFDYNYAAYQHWQKLAFVLAQELHAREGFEVVHQVNVCTFREPGYTWQMGVPFLWGPMGGSQNLPWRFLPMLPAKEAAKELVRGCVNGLSLRFKPRVRRAAKAAAMVVGANSTNQRDYRRVFGRDVELLLETGLAKVEEPDRSRFEARAAASREGRVQAPLKILWSGQLQTRKALPVLLRALARVEVAFELRVLGDGPMEVPWKAEALALGLDVVGGGPGLKPGCSAGDIRGLKPPAPSGGLKPPAPSWGLKPPAPSWGLKPPTPSWGLKPPAPSGELKPPAPSEKTVEFLGRLPFVEAVAQMEWAELFCFTSLRDTSGNVILEALAAGVPVVCFDHQGSGDMVSSTSGVKIAVSSPKLAVEEFAEAIAALAEDGERLLELSCGATVQARKFLWERNGDWVNAVYRRLAGVAVAPKVGEAGRPADETIRA